MLHFHFSSLLSKLTGDPKPLDIEFICNLDGGLHFQKSGSLFNHTDKDVRRKVEKVELSVI
jgi:hypothetical protein